MNWTLHPIARFDELAADWNALNAAAGGIPFLDTRFMVPLIREFGDPGMRIAVCEDAGGPQAMGIFVRTNAVQWDTFQPSQLPLGAWLMRPGQEYEPLLSGLARKLPGLTLALGLHQQDPDCTPRPDASRSLQTLDYIQTARVAIAGSFDDYWSARGKNLRQNMKKQRTRLQKDGTPAVLEIVTRPADVAGAVADYGRLESAGWKATGGTAIHPDNAQGRFYRAMLESFGSAGAARIYRYRIGEHIMAVDLCIEGGGAIVILKTTYDETVKTLSPAFLMREEYFRLLFEERKLNRVEFFGKVLEYHLRWTDDVRTLYHVNYYRAGLVPRFRAFATRFRRPGESGQAA